MAVKQVFNTSAELDFPNVLPTLDLDFANSKTLDPRIDFTRASGGSYVGAGGLIKYAGVNEARFDHDPMTGESLGLLIEEQRSNLFNHTEDFTQLPVSGIQNGWFRGRVILTTESITAPDGSSSVSLLTENTTSFGEHYVNQEIFNYTSGVTYTWSWYVKPNGRDNVYCKVYTNFNNTQVILNLETSSEYYLTGTTFDNITNTKLPNGWYRVSFTSTAISTGAGSVLLGFAQSETVRSYTGDGSSGMYYWGAQVEAGAFPTSYIPTTDTTVTRAADVASISGSNFSSWYRQDEGTIYHLYEPFGGASERRIFSLDDGTGDNKYLGAASNSNGSGANYIQITSGGVNQGFLGVDAYTETRQSGAFAYISNNAGFSKNGSTTSLDSSVLIPTINILNIGSDLNNNAVLNGTISRLTYFPKRLPNSQLISLTS